MRRGGDKPEREKDKQRRPGSPPCSEEKDDRETQQNKPWHNVPAQRLACALPTQDNSFCMEDEPQAVLAENYLYALSISDPLQAGNPLVFVSHGFEALSGYPSSEVLGVNCKILQGEGTEADKVAELRAGMDGRRFTSVELTNYKQDKRPYTNLLSIAPVIDGYDNLIKFVAVQCDLNERKRWEQVDETFVARWQDSVRQHLEASLLLDCSTLDSGSPATVSAVSTGFSALTGYSQLEMLGSNCLCLAGPDSNPKAMKKLIQMQAACKPVAVKLLCYKKDGTPFWGYLFSCPLMPQGRMGSVQQTLCIIVDITATRLKRVGKYALGKVIGSGAYGIVRIGKSTTSDEIVAVKTVDGSQFRSISEIEQMQEEMNVLSSLKHPNIIRLIEVHFTNNIFFLIMEFASGGSLVKFIYQHENHRLPETEAQRIFVAMSSALDYCHRRRVIHRDLKPENILMDESNNIKIADFGLAAVTAPFGHNLTQQCGTPEFAAPEITTGKEYDGPSVDIWSMGVILYEALTGTLPFKGATHSALCKAIQRGVYEPLPPHISSSCKDLIKAMLTVDASLRITLDQILRHPWCRESACGLPRLHDMGEDPEDHGRNRRRSASSRRSEAGLARKSSRNLGGSMDDLDDSLCSPAGRSQGSSEGTRGGYYRRSQDGEEAPPQEAMHDSLRLVIDGAQDDPITAAIMRAQKHMQNLNIINDHHHYGQESTEEEPKACAGNTLNKGLQRRGGAGNAQGNIGDRKGSLDLGRGAASTAQATRQPGSMAHFRDPSRRLECDTPQHNTARHPVSLPGVSHSGHLKAGRPSPHPSPHASGTLATGAAGQQGLGSANSTGPDRGKRGTGELPHIPTRGGASLPAPSSSASSKFSKYSTSVRVREEAAAVAAGGARGGRSGQGTGVAGDRMLGPSAVPRRR